MDMAEKCLVTGGNGHLGNNLIRILLDKGKKVKATVRNLEYKEPFKGLDCEVVYADLLDKKSLLKAMEGVDILYQVAAVFKHWAKNPQKEIIMPNLEGTKNVMEAATEAGVEKVIYVSSVVALDRTQLPQPMNEEGWNNTITFPYYLSKTESEKLAWKIAEEKDLWMVSVLPSAIVGPNCFGHLTPTLELLNRILMNKMPVDVNFYFNFVDVRDVAEGMILAAEKGKNGNRYTLGNERSTSTTEIIELARKLYPDVKKPVKLPKSILKTIVFFIEFGKIFGIEPPILRTQVDLYYGVEEKLDISKAKSQLGYNPRNPEEAIRDTLIYLKRRNDR
jgi:dihydroflavonol-4-reductase